MDGPACFICDKHTQGDAAQGGALFEDDLGVPHLHVHLAPRYPGTPRDYWGSRLRDWPDAPQVDDTEMRRLAAHTTVSRRRG